MVSFFKILVKTTSQICIQIPFVSQYALTVISARLFDISTLIFCKQKNIFVKKIRLYILLYTL